MILRRMADGIRQQDWFTVIVEVLVVVVGIFLGLQVDDWNQARENRHAEQEFLNRLHEDVLNAERAYKMGKIPYSKYKETHERYQKEKKT